MKSQVPNTVIKLAIKARQLTEKFAEQYPAIGDPYNLQCYCAIGSKIFQSLAKKAGIDILFVQGRFLRCADDYELLKETKLRSHHINHCWNLYKNHIIDVTATQFGFKDKVFIQDKKEAKQHCPIEVNKRPNTSDWDPLQNPSQYTGEIRNLIGNYT